MTDLLIRGIDPETKRRLAIQAAENSRSQSAEALAILRVSLDTPRRQSWDEFLSQARHSIGTVTDFPLPPRTIEEERPVFTDLDELIGGEDN